ncbi:MAG: glycoside hydrolase family 2 TIM barrel-domain containing protein [Lachnospiraceae bacterium]|nr:glycoside hydrolase family 2 TIM barrel-domain containing protein [Lachnospiraceae bacterium]
MIKEAGFNSIRSSHHPISKAMQDICDEIGIIVMDELFDMWTVHKNNHDFALHFLDEWEKVMQ